MSAPHRVEVAVGAVIRDDGAVLLADRPAGKAYAGYWEFPGGKIEVGETVAEALARELHEELGIEVAASGPWVVYEHVYPHAHVRLNFRRVFDWSGAPHPRDGQRLMFLDRAGEPPRPLLPAAQPALRWLALPAAPLLADADGLSVADLDAARAGGDEAAVIVVGTRDELDRIPPALLDAAQAAGVALLAAIDDPAPAPARAGAMARMQGVGFRLRPRAVSSLERAAVASAAAGADFVLLDDSSVPPQAAWALPIYRSLASLPASGEALHSARNAGLHGIAWRR